jgi:hypothetical protein
MEAAMHQAAGPEMGGQAQSSSMQNVRGKWKGMELDFLEINSQASHTLTGIVARDEGGTMALSKLDECSATNEEEACRHLPSSTTATTWNSCMLASRTNVENVQGSTDEISISRAKPLSLTCNMCERPWIQGPRKKSQERRCSNLALEVCERLVDSTLSSLHRRGQDLQDEDENAVGQHSPSTRRVVSGNSGKHWMFLGPALVDAKLPGPSLHASPGDIGKRRSMFSCAGNPIFESVPSMRTNSSPTPLARRYAADPLNSMIMLQTNRSYEIMITN